jgi:hypothetical protein
MNIALRGGVIGALGGVLFTLLMSPGAPSTVHAYDLGGQLFGSLASHFRMLALAIPAFGAIGWLLADRVFAAQETMYQSMLQAGAQVPAEKPQMQLADRGPALAVAIAAAVIVAFIIALFVAYW